MIGPGGVTEDELRWETEAIDAQHTSLERVRATAGAWSGSIAGLLGVFSVVAFLKGPTAVSSLDKEAAVALTVLVLLAAAFAAAALVTGAIAAQGTPKALDRLDGAALRAANRDASNNVISLLWWSRSLAIIAAACVLSGMGTAWLSAPKTKQGKQNVLVVTGSGAASCGTLSKSKGRLALRIGGKGPAIRVRRVEQVIAVEKCP